VEIAEGGFEAKIGVISVSPVGLVALGPRGNGDRATNLLAPILARNEGTVPAAGGKKLVKASCSLT